MEIAILLKNLRMEVEISGPWNNTSAELSLATVHKSFKFKNEPIVTVAMNGRDDRRRPCPIHEQLARLQTNFGNKP